MIVIHIEKLKSRTFFLLFLNRYFITFCYKGIVILDFIFLFHSHHILLYQTKQNVYFDPKHMKHNYEMIILFPFSLSFPFHPNKHNLIVIFIKLF